MDFVSLPDINTLIAVEKLSHENPYDFRKPHRHTYFEIFLIEKSSGFQYIDFNKYPLQAHAVYTVYPGQVHLLQRQQASGVVVQFKKEVFNYLHPLKHHLFYFTNPHLVLPQAVFSHIYDLVLVIEEFLKTKEVSFLMKEKLYSYFKVFLINIVEHSEGMCGSAEVNYAGCFLSSLAEHIKTKRKVADYALLLETTPAKLSEACKATLGKTPLKLIHEELLLEIKRMMLLNELSLKEIAFELNFDSQANFSGFIKQQTGKTPSELQTFVAAAYV